MGTITSNIRIEVRYGVCSKFPNLILGAECGDNLKS
jgi:hypothetical protein